MRGTHSCRVRLKGRCGDRCRLFASMRDEQASEDEREVEGRARSEVNKSDTTLFVRRKVKHSARRRRAQPRHHGACNHEDGASRRPTRGAAPPLRCDGGGGAVPAHARVQPPGALQLARLNHRASVHVRKHQLQRGAQGGGWGAEKDGAIYHIRQRER